MPIDPHPTPTDSMTERISKTQIAYHRYIFFLCLLMLSAAFVLQNNGSEQVALPGSRVQLPGLCLWKRWTGIDCPGCGMTRCFIALAHGHPVRAWRFHPMGIVVFGLIVAQLPYRLMQLRRLAVGRAEWKSRFLVAICWIVMIGILLQWFIKMSVHLVEA